MLKILLSIYQKMSALDDIQRISADEVKTGDALLFTNNTHTGLLMRVACSSFWTHSGIAVRLKKTRNQRGEKIRKITCDNTGELFVLELDSEPRMEEYTNTFRRGFGITSIEHLTSTQTLIAVRPLKSKFRTDATSDITLEFIQRYITAEFPEDVKPFIGVWLEYPMAGMGLRRNKRDKVEFFCSEMMAYYYINIFIRTFLGKNTEHKEGEEYVMHNIFGTNAPISPEFIAPHHYDPYYTLDAPMFEKDAMVLHRSRETVSSTLAMPFLLTVAVSGLIWLSLPHNSWAETSKNTNKSNNV